MATNTPPSAPTDGSAGTSSSTHSDDPKQQAQQKAQDLKEEAKSRAEAQAQRGKEQAGGTLEDVAGALHDTGDALRDRDQDTFAHYADAAAGQVDNLARAIRDRSVGELLDEADRFARRDAGLFLGGAFLLGIFGARFLKASGSEGQGRSSQGRRYEAAASHRSRPATRLGTEGSDPYRSEPLRERQNPRTGTADVRRTAEGDRPSPPSTGASAAGVTSTPSPSSNPSERHG